MKTVLFLIISLSLTSSVFANNDAGKADACKQLSEMSYTIRSCTDRIFDEGHSVYSIFVTSNSCSILEIKIDFNKDPESSITKTCVEPW